MNKEAEGVGANNVEDIHTLLDVFVKKRMPVSLVLAHGYQKSYEGEITKFEYTETKALLRINRKHCFVIDLSLVHSKISINALANLNMKPIILYLNQGDSNYFVYGQVVRIISKENFVISCELETRLFKRRRRVYTRFVNPLDEVQRQAPLWIKDLSIDGICLISQQPMSVKVGDELCISVMIPQVQNNSLFSYVNQEWKVDVVNLRNSEEGLVLGCRLIDRRNEHLPTIQKYILKLQRYGSKNEPSEFKIPIPPIKVKAIRAIT